MRRAAVLIACLLLGSCGLHPLYAGGSGGTVAVALAGVEIGAIGGKNGWLLRGALDERLHRADGGDGPAKYRLDVELDDQIEGFGIRRDATVTRERRTLRARYKLVDTKTNAVLLDATAGSDQGIDVVSSEYATIAAEQTALENLVQAVADQITTRVALYARRSGQTPAS